MQIESFFQIKTSVANPKYMTKGKMIGKVIFFFCTSVEQLKTIDIHLMIKNSKRYLTASICKRERIIKVEDVV
jgi:pentose-5-phosphate-3-epimerase